MADETGDLTVSEFRAWLRSKDALRLLTSTFHDAGTAIEAIGRRVGTGDIRCVAGKATWKDGTTRVSHERFELSPRWLEGAPDFHRNSSYWVVGDLSLTAEIRFGTRVTVEVLDLRLDPGALQELVAPETSYSPASPPGHGTSPPLATAASPPALPARFPDARGAPPKTIFEDALLAVAHRWHMGDFKPSRQADVQRALADWLAANEVQAGDTAIKERAKKLWDRFKE